MRGLDEKQRKSSMFGLQLSTLENEIKTDRLVRVLCIVAAPFLVINLFYQNLATIMIFEASLLTAFAAGIVLILKPKSFARLRLEKAITPLLLLHMVVLVGVLFWDKANQEIAGKGLVVTSVLWISMMIEGYAVYWVLEICAPRESQGGRD